MTLRTSKILLVFSVAIFYTLAVVTTFVGVRANLLRSRLDHQ